jgi:molecular chaperone GrpE (heat shock protein)
MHPDPATPPATGNTATSPISEDLPSAEPNLPLTEDPELTTHLARIDADLVKIAQRMATESDRAAARERVIDRQHEDIERLRGVERAGLMRPVVTDLCRLRNALLLQASTRPETMTGAQVTDLLASFADMVEQALERCGVAVLALEPGCPFVAGRHQVARSVIATDPALDGRVAEILQDGYAEVDGGRIVAPARVAVHRAAPAAPPPTETTTEIPAKETIDG